MLAPLTNPFWIPRVRLTFMAWMPRRSLFVLIAITLVLRLCWAGAMEMANDEAYHFLYTLHPDWSYFDHPPMLMWVASLGRWLCGGWLHPLSLRLGFVLLFAGSTWIMFDWTARWFGERAGFYAALALNVAAYFSAGAGTFVLPDGPFLFFALLTMRNLTEALFTKVDGVAVMRVEVKSPVRSDVIAWMWVGFACAGALTSKYHGALLPIATLCYVIVTPRAWPVLRTPGPYLAAILGGCGLIPILVWNAQHEWASLAFQGARLLAALGLVPGNRTSFHADTSISRADRRRSVSGLFIDHASHPVLLCLVCSTYSAALAAGWILPTVSLGRCIMGAQCGGESDSSSPMGYLHVPLHADDRIIIRLPSSLWHRQFSVEE
jgi:hypothetical protein